MKVLHVTPSFYPALIYGGPTQSVYQLCCALRRNHCDVRVLTTDANGPHAVLDVDTTKDVQIVEGLYVRYCHRIMDVSVSPTLLRLLTSRIRWADVVHLMAVYSFPTIPTLLACKLMRKPIVWSPRGMLQRWEGTRRRRLKAVWELLCRICSPRQLVLHVTSEQEATETTKRFPNAEIALILNGVEVPSTINHWPSEAELRIVYLGRLDPIKGIENLLTACSLLNGDVGKPVRLTIGGGGDQNYTEKIRAHVSRLAIAKQVQMVGTVIGDAKRRLFENADIVVSPSHRENFNIVVAEALAHGVPVIASKGTPWKRVEDVGCGLWVSNDPKSLAAAITQMNRMPLREMGRRGREWMQREFSWDLMAERTIELYDSLVNRKTV